MENQENMENGEQEVEGIVDKVYERGIDFVDCILDILVDREKEFEVNGKLTNNDLLKREIKILLDERKDNLSVDTYDFVNEWADHYVPTYTYDTLKWYNNDISRISYADDALTEFGSGSNSIINIMNLGIYQCLELFALMVLGEVD